LAAARHLLDLYAVFGSWNLAQAAYNAGERTVLEAIRAMGTSDFWALARGRWLKDETKNYVPAIKAATLIAREPERYGFTVTPAEPLAYELVSVPGSTALKALASACRVDVETLERLNPELRLKQTPPGGSYSLKVPIGSAALLRAALDREPGLAAGSTPHTYGARAAAHPPATRSASTLLHTVKRQETVSTIAKQYGVSVTDIIRWNGLGDGARIRPGDKLRVASGKREETASRVQ
jgi:membrane-bound lytic murein transglycosylase D